MDATRTEGADEYRCPGEAGTISRSVHLGRLARFYPGCRRCGFRDDTGTLSPRHVKQLAETRHRGLERDLFTDEGVSGVYLNELGPAEAREMAAALGVLLRSGHPPGEEQSDGPLARSSATTGHGIAERSREVVLAGDGRPAAAELVAAVSEGLRWSGCGVIDVGQATAPCVASAVAQLGASGGILVGNPAGRPETVGLKLWAGGPRPLSAGPALDEVRRLSRAAPSRPTRRFGPLRRCQAEGTYLAGLAERYHALRPLRVALSTGCRPVLGYLERLTAAVACEVLPCPAPADRLAEHVRDAGAHFGIVLGDDGETASVFDERGQPVADERLLLLLAWHLLAEDPSGTIVIAEGLGPELAGCIAALGGRYERSEARRATMVDAVRRSGALLGGASGGRAWFQLGDGVAAADGLWTLTLLLEILSQSDRPLSVVLDSVPARR